MMYKVKNQEIEGQHILQDVTPVILSKFRILLAVTKYSNQIIISIISGSLFALFLKWNSKLYQSFLFLQSNEKDCSHYIVTNTQNQSFVCKKIPIQNNSYFIYRFLKYTFRDNFYHPVSFVEELINSLKQKQEKLNFFSNTLEERLIRFKIFGNSELIIPIKTLFQYLFEELTSPFYILQYFSIVLWIFEGFVLFAIVLLCFSFFACIVNYILMRRSRQQLQQLAKIKQNVKFLDGEIIDGSQLVVGDKFYVEDDMQLTCDSFLIQGDCMVNEATLTGETIPIPKQLLNDLDTEITHSTLFEGAKIVQVTKYTQCVAIVIRTGYSSIRGQYFRNVIFPPSPSRKFYIQACKFQILFGIIILLIYTIMVFTVFIDLDYSTSLLVMRYFDYMTWIIPPALPIFFSLAQTVALLQLRKKFIMGSNPLKTEEAGKIDTICFDKTGTLSTLGLQACDYYPHSEQIQEAMACCHHLLQLNDELKGDPLEIEMFKSSGWDIIFENQKYFSVTNREKFLQIIRINEFSSQLQLMSVIAVDTINNNYYLFVKGSPEKIMKISVNKINETIQETLQTMTYNGLRVIGLGYKKLNVSQLEEDRQVLENEIFFSGIFSLENRLKGDTAIVIQELMGSNLDIRIISGDNPLTTTHCAFESKIIDNKNNSIILDYDQSSDQLLVLDLRQQVPSSSRSQGDSKVCSQYNFVISQLELIFNSECNFTITGNLWGYLMQNKITEISLNQSADQKQNYNNLKQIDEFDQKFLECLNKLLQKTKIYSRMKPHQKKEVVQYLQNNLGKSVMMVGDGANDCSAIAEALVGVSFNSSDASFTSPFSYQFDSISCVTLILLQGRATKNIIIELFQYLVLISSLKLTGTTILQIQGMNFGDFQYIYMNYMSSVPVLILMTLSRAHNYINNSLPNDDLFAISNQLQFYSVFIFTSIGCIILAIIVILRSESPEIEKPIQEYQREGPLNSAMMIANQYFNMLICILVYQSQPFKSKLYYNYPLLFWIIICLLIAFLVTFNQPSRSWLSVVDINQEIFDHADIVMYFVILGSALLGYLCQHAIRLKYPQTIQIYK